MARPALAHRRSRRSRFRLDPARLLLLSDTAALTSVLLSHVTSGRQDLRVAFVAPRDIKTIQVQEVFAERERDALFIDNARVIGRPIVTDNGVIHVVASVLLPHYRQAITAATGRSGNSWGSRQRELSGTAG